VPLHDFVSRDLQQVERRFGDELAHRTPRDLQRAVVDAKERLYRESGTLV
jgi:DNA-binding transcriptional LysR family regulator